MQAYRNKWPADWANFWFYHKIRLDLETNTSPLWVERIPVLGKTLVIAVPETAEAKAFVALLREVAKSFSTRDLVKEFSACQCFPIQEGWSVTSWVLEEKWIKGIPMPDFMACFSIGRDSMFFLLLPSTLNADVYPKVAETAADEAVGPMGNVEFKQLVEKLGFPRKNRVFSFFGIVPPRR